jgi:hypothetical protein
MRIPRFSGLRRRREKGSITMEMALAMPVLLFLIAGVIDLSMLYWEKHIVTNAALEGARAATNVKPNDGSNPNKSKSGVQQVVQNYLTKFKIKDLNGHPLALSSDTFDYSRTDPPNRILTVTLKQIPYKMILLPNIKTLFGEARTDGDGAFYLSAQTSMAAQWSNPPSP